MDVQFQVRARPQRHVAIHLKRQVERMVRHHRRGHVEVVIQPTPRALERAHAVQVHALAHLWRRREVSAVISEDGWLREYTKGREWLPNATAQPNRCFGLMSLRFTVSHLRGEHDCEQPAHGLLFVVGAVLRSPLDARLDPPATVATRREGAESREHRVRRKARQR